MRQPFLHDQYAPLSHVPLLGDRHELAAGLIGTVATWVPRDDNRRLRAYEILAAYRDNVRRHYLPAELPDDQRSKYREYGHNANLVLNARSALLGETQQIRVPAADAADSDDDTATTNRARATAARDWLTWWAGKESLWLKMLEAEYDCIGLGDTVYALGWDPLLGRPRLRTYDPGWYFPVLTDDDPDDFPRAVHIAWEQRVSDRLVELHVLTWRLGTIRPALDVELSGPDGPVYAYDEDGRPLPQPGDRTRRSALGLLELVRRYPWAERDSPQTCHFTHAIYDLSKIRGDLFDLRAPARYAFASDGTEQRDLDLRVDFLPVVHVPNSPATKEHFGRSTLTLLAQLLDDVAGTDTDLAVASALVGSATLVTKGAPGAADVIAGPSTTLDLPEGGSAAYLDTSRNLDALLKLLAKLEKTVSVNSRFAQALLGRVDAKDAPSGYALELSFQPTRSVVGEMRLVRDMKYGLLLKMAVRFAQAAKLVPAGPTPDAHVQLGEFIPPDLTSLVDQVCRLVTDKVISRPTGLRMLLDAGFPIEDITAELERVRQEDLAGAGELLDITGDVDLVRGRLGLPPEDASDPDDPDA